MVEHLFVQSNVGVVLGIKLNYDYKDLFFIPLKPLLHQQTSLAWKKEQFFLPTRLFLSNMPKSTLRDDKNIIFFNT